MMEFTGLEYTHIYREYNQEADQMSKKVVFLPEGNLIYFHLEDREKDPDMLINLFNAHL
jgi:hypothetical protein